MNYQMLKMLMMMMLMMMLMMMMMMMLMMMLMICTIVSAGPLCSPLLCWPVVTGQLRSPESGELSLLSSLVSIKSPAQPLPVRSASTSQIGR